MASLARPEKHSLTLRGHRTSVTLEPAFWQAFCEMAAARGQGINALATEIDAARDGADQGLASAIRLFILAQYRAALAGHPGLGHPALGHPGRPGAGQGRE